jgi:transcription initiation factor IIE alpha subunit
MKEEGKEVTMNVVYACPMDCENGKTYDKEGKCPVCEMDLKKVEKE